MRMRIEKKRVIVEEEDEYLEGRNAVTMKSRGKRKIMKSMIKMSSRRGRGQTKTINEQQRMMKYLGVGLLLNRNRSTKGQSKECFEQQRVQIM